MLFDEEMMLLALEEAKKAAEIGEVPVGAIVINENGEIIGRGHNLRETENCPTAHAEIIAIEQAAKKLGSWRLTNCTLYVTLEPCPMCAGAIINSHLKRVVYGAFDENMGACASVTELFEKKFGWKPLVRSRVLEQECSEILKKFFKGIR